MHYWFASIRPHKKRCTSLSEAETYKQENGGTIQSVPVYKSERAVEDWIREQDDPSLYLPREILESSKPTKRKPYEPNRRIQIILNSKIPPNIYFVI